MHISRVHRDVVSQDPNRLVLPGEAESGTVPAGGSGVVTRTSQTVSLSDLPTLKSSVRVLRHIPKGARSLAAGKLCTVIEDCLRTNGVEEWFNLLSFSYSALRVPNEVERKSLTAKVKHNIDNSDLYFPVDQQSSTKPASMYRAIEAKVHDGDLRGAVRLLLSDSSLAPINDNTLGALREKHPSPSRPAVLPPEPSLSSPFLSVAPLDVANALSSFYNGSASGLDGLRPQHLKEMTSSSAGSNGPRLLESLAKLCNFLLRGMLNLEVRPFLYGATLCALSKKDGGIRPIAVGSVFRRLTAKLCCRAVRDVMADYLQPHQVGFGTALGCEAAIHSTRSFAVRHEASNKVIVKIDIKNAFNSVERDTILSEVLEHTSSLYPFVYQCYASPSNLYFSGSMIQSQVGAQQGDPLGPLLFCLAIQKVISGLKAPLNIWYLDDGVIGGAPEVVLEDLRKLVPALKAIGLEVNASKCELFVCGGLDTSYLTDFESVLPGIRQIDKSSLNLLGAPVFTEGVSSVLQTKRQALSLAREHLLHLSGHVSLVLLRNCFALPRMVYVLRTSPTWLFEHDLEELDGTLKLALESILNVNLNEAQWCQAALPVRYGGLGVRRVQDVGLVAFLASAHGSADLVARILSSDGNNTPIPYASEAMAKWVTLCPTDDRPDSLVVQRGWDDIVCKRTYSRLVDGASGAALARLKAVLKPESGAWLHALPSPQLGTLLDNDSLRIAVALRLGSKVCEAHRCVCGVTVEENGHHGLSCQRCAGRLPRHHSINDIVRRAMVSANVPCVLEPPGLSRTDGKRPDGLTLVPWRRGRCLLWDATCVSTFAASHLRQTIRTAGSAAETAAKHKRAKYSALEQMYDFVPVAVETAGPWCVEALELFRELGKRLRQKGNDPRSGSWLVQQVSIAIQRGNAASIMGTFGSGRMQGGV